MCEQGSGDRSSSSKAHRPWASDNIAIMTSAELRPLAALLAAENPAWPWIEDLLRTTSVDVVVEQSTTMAETCLFRLQVTVGSTLGALAAHTGGMRVDHGWLRVLGGGSAHILDLATANGLREPASGESPGLLFVAFDVLGGRFALNGGALAGELGSVHYWAPDTLDWQPLGFGHSAFIQWSLSGSLEDFYRELRWEGWRGEVLPLESDVGIVAYPPPFTQEGRELGSVTRSPVPWEELSQLFDEYSRQLDDGSPGGKFHVQVTEE
jgi:hypothetical protein